MIVRHIFEIGDDSRMRITRKNRRSSFVVRRSSFVHDMEDDFALRYVRIYPGLNSRAELVTLAPALRAVGSGLLMARHGGGLFTPVLGGS